MHVTEVYKDHISLSWEEPESDGGSPITGYVIEKRDASKTTWITAGNVDKDTMSFQVTKLFEGSSYLFRVSAENKIGIGEPAALSEPVTAKLGFGKLTFSFVECFNQALFSNSGFL